MCLNVRLSLQFWGPRFNIFTQKFGNYREQKEEAIYISFHKFICIIPTRILHTLKYRFRTSFNPNYLEIIKKVYLLIFLYRKISLIVVLFMQAYLVIFLAYTVV